jgi:hypothetical protein
MFRKAIMKRYRWRLEQFDSGTTARATVLVGAALGVLVSISSVGAGAVGVTALLLLYPQLPMTRIVGSDIAHAVPLTLVAGIGHWATGAIDWHLVGVLLVGSLPGIVIGSYCAHRVPETALRLVLAATLILVAGNLASHELHSSSSIIAAFAPSAARRQACSQAAPRQAGAGLAFRLLRAVTNPSPPRRPWPRACAGRATSFRARTPASRNCRRSL